jgi:FkbM family methyltransferase
MYKLSLRGIGVLNSENLKVSGEKYLLKYILPKLNVKTVFDVGANNGGYSKIIKRYLPQTDIYAFEPHPETYKILKKNVKGKAITCFNIGFSEKVKKTKLWDFANNADLKYTQPTSTISSIYKGVIKDLHKQKAKSYNIKLTTIDSFVKTKKIKSIDFLKIDTEGSEYFVLKGARKMLSEAKIKLILFEVNEMNVVSRVFFKDFVDLLSNYHLYRLLPDGLVEINNYRPKNHEIFAYHNVIAIERGLMGNIKNI